ncbi:hypothetical protein [Mammaliicoccus sciuri]|uniref:hypothetical protein n=1 Tax=Mammaliicoccus sciuri TaxID=1296 RepID=UPI0030CF30C1
MLKLYYKINFATEPFHLYPGGYHEFEAMVPDSEISKRAVAESIRALNEALNTN